MLRRNLYAAPNHRIFYITIWWWQLNGKSLLYLAVLCEYYIPFKFNRKCFENANRFWMWWPWNLLKYSPLWKTHNHWKSLRNIRNAVNSSIIWGSYVVRSEILFSFQIELSKYKLYINVLGTKSRTRGFREIQILWTVKKTEVEHARCFFLTTAYIISVIVIYFYVLSLQSYHLNWKMSHLLYKLIKKSFNSWKLRKSVEKDVKIQYFILNRKEYARHPVISSLFCKKNYVASV